MEQVRFDEFTQALGTTRSRRAALTAGLAALLPVAASSRVAAKPKQKCGACEQRKGKTKCKPRRDNAACNGVGRCRDGRCFQPPGCASALAFCVQNSSCCSGVCDTTAGGSCFSSQPGEQCNVDADCAFGTCVGYVCQV